MITEKGNDDLIYEIGFGGGLAYKAGKAGMFYGLFKNKIDMGGCLDENYALGTGLDLGWLATWKEAFTANLRVFSGYYYLGERHFSLNAILGFNVALYRHTGINITLKGKRAHGISLGEAGLSLNFYF